MIFRKPALFIIVSLLLLTPKLGFGRLWTNHTEIAYSESDVSSVLTDSHSLNYYIEVAGAYYFKSNMDIQNLLNLYELQDIQSLDFKEMTVLLDNAIANMTCSLDNYMLLIEKAERTPYNPAIIEALKFFEYDDFREYFKLNRCVFGEIEDLLKRGDVTGVYRSMQDRCFKINAKLINIKKMIEQGVLPDQTEVWEINELFAHTSLFGSYIARIFFTIK